MAASGSHRRSKSGRRGSRAERPATRAHRNPSSRIDPAALAFVVVPALVLFGLVFVFGHWYFFLAGYVVILAAVFLFTARSASRRR